MVDNTELPGTGEVYASEDRGGVKFQKVLCEILKGRSKDSAGRLRVSEPKTQFDSKLLASDLAPLFWDNSLESGIGITISTPTISKPYIDFTSTLNTAGKFTRQTFRRFNYQPGKSQLIIMTGVLDLSGGGTGCIRRIGYFDDDNGIFFEDNAGITNVVIRSNDTGTPIDRRIPQWNLDRLNGTNNKFNPSGISVNWSKSQIFLMDFQWFSLGPVRFAVEIAGEIQYIHEISQTNIETIPWSSTPNLPLRYQIITSSDSPASKMRIICSTVISEGGINPLGLTHSHSTTDHVNADVEDDVYALIGIRLKSNQLGCNLEIENVSMLMETKNKDYEWILIHNPTVAGTFTYVDHANSCVQVAIGDSVGMPSVNTVIGGTIITRGFGTDNTAVNLNLKNSLSLGSAIDGALDELVLAIRPLNTNSSVQGSLTWRELF